MIKKHIYKTSLVLIILLTVNNIFAQTTSDITVNEIKEHIYFLADDSLQGRKPGTEGGKISAEYIKSQFESYGLETIGDDGFQYFDVTMRVMPGEANKLVFEGTKYTHKTDFIVMPFSTNDKLDSEVVFVGFGMEIKHDSLKWNDYKDIDVNGKIVMVLRGDPEPKNEESLFISYASDRDKVILARDKGAIGVLFVNGPQFGTEKLAKPMFNRVTADAGLPVVNISTDLANTILKDQNINIDSLENSISSSFVSNSFSINKNISFQTDQVKETVTTQNIVAVLRGNDPSLKAEFVVIGAHYDHLGFGGPGSGSRMQDTIAIHNGADDNASGVAGVLELAQKLSSQKETIKRSVLFMAFAAEEMGLLGSQYFANEALIDMNKVNIMMNFDMIGRLDADEKGIVLGGTGTAVEFDELLNKFEENSEIAVTRSPEGYGASDHASFYSSGIPVMFFFTGAHADYHTPFDDADKINYEGEKEILDFAYPMLEYFVNSDSSLTFKEAGSKAKKRDDRRGLKVKLGIMPDFTATENDGLGIGGVTKGGPAYTGGLLKGDKITAINGLSINNIYDYMARLKKLEPGQTISVDILRDGKKKVFVIVL